MKISHDEYGNVTHLGGTIPSNKRKYPCDVCNFRAATPTGLSIHKRWSHVR